MLRLYLFAANPFIEAYTSADMLGKGLFLALLLLSIISLSIGLKKLFDIKQAQKRSLLFEAHLLKEEKPLASISYQGEDNPFASLFSIIKKESEPLKIKTLLDVQAASEYYKLSSHLYILSTAAGLAPLMGLLGTVWGILLTFSEMQSGAGQLSNSAMLSGLSLALTTTVLGLLIAIPAYIAFSYLKNCLEEFDIKMDHFSHFILERVQIEKDKK